MGTNMKDVISSKYLGVLVTKDNEMKEEIKARIAVGNRAYQALLKVMKSHDLSRNLKIKTCCYVWLRNIDHDYCRRRAAQKMGKEGIKKDFWCNKGGWTVENMEEQRTRGTLPIS
ncbi:hypothetical protein J437_LFUL016319 [Ladona fulva]|uniref:Uncharacterized protein n=1 Tax=Ladona fulva TaxID=123851 RepID=A0A8K0PDV0_LADFU|nr:hypothetical protein J437_LFUL016319 [Ladona fulva]